MTVLLFRSGFGVKPSKFGYQLILKKTPSLSLKLSLLLGSYFAEILCLELYFVNWNLADSVADWIIIYFVNTVSYSIKLKLMFLIINLSKFTSGCY